MFINSTNSDSPPSPQNVFKKITNTPEQWRIFGAVIKNVTVGLSVTGMGATAF